MAVGVGETRTFFSFILFLFLLFLHSQPQSRAAWVEVQGSFSIDYSDSSENITLKLNSLFLYFATFIPVR